jgi:hypothetical protein
MPLLELPAPEPLELDVEPAPELLLPPWPPPVLPLAEPPVLPLPVPLPLPLPLPLDDELPPAPESSPPSEAFSDDGVGMLAVPPYGPPSGLGSPPQPVHADVATASASAPVEKRRRMKSAP